MIVDNDDSGEQTVRRGRGGRKPRIVDNDDSDVPEPKPKRGRGRGRGRGAKADRGSSYSSSDRKPKKPSTVLDEFGNPIVKRRGRPPKNPEKIA